MGEQKSKVVREVKKDNSIEIEGGIGDKPMKELGAEIYDLRELKKIRQQLKNEGKTVVFTNGCFDILHSGHIYLFKEAKKYGDILIVGVNSDDSVKKIKGGSRPVFPLEERLEVLQNIEYIDYLTSFPEEIPRKIISALKPDVLIKGGDWMPDEVIGRKEVEKTGGKVVVIPYVKGRSTSKIINRINSSFS
jgi:D-beta-D-heptose 7-phosphate kinase/D-beta-D-heptose 1-phosphate adenosyltransferase